MQACREDMRSVTSFHARSWGPWVLAFLLSACSPDLTPRNTSHSGARAQSPDETAVADFLRDHWAWPLAPQGMQSTGPARPGASLAPEHCGSCHVGQFEDWRLSLHSKAMGPGILGQLLEMPAHARQDHQECLRCHAPLAEQADSLVAAIDGSAQYGSHRAGDPRAAPDGTAPLHAQGVVCAACHLRGNEVHGPPRRDGSGPADGASASPHGGWKPNTAFEDSRFCAGCHQFDADGYALNGKLLQNTLQEWQSSRYAREGIACQGCHMPDRRHLWRGIHDAEMVKRGVGIVAGQVSIANGHVLARLRVTNAGVGHYFPTYVTPSVVVRGVQRDAAGRELRGTSREFVIARQVSPDLDQELSDTRIAPDAFASFDYRAARHPRATTVAWKVEVRPDAFYLDFYQARLRTEPAGRGRAQIARARDQAAASAFVIYAADLKLR